jgi:hypothetical protein
VVTPFFEQVEGKSFYEMLQCFGPLNPQQIVTVVRQIIEVLSFLNDLGYSYGVMSSKDIFLVSGESIKIEHSA